MDAGAVASSGPRGAALAAALAAVLAAVLAVVLALSACSAQPPAPQRVPDGVTVEIFQNRLDYAARVLEVEVTNHGTADLDLVSATFRSPYFADAARWDEPLVIRAGSSTDLRLSLAAPRCGGADGAGDQGGTGRVTLEWRTGDKEETARAALTPRDTRDTITRINGQDCLAQAVEALMTITEPALLRVDGVGGASVAWIDLTLSPTGAEGSITIDHVGATVLLASSSGLDWPVGATLSARSAPRTVSLGLRPTRCDPHAVADDKRGTVFPFAVTTSTGEAGTYDHPIGDALRGQIYGWIAAHCGS
jgi:hypothetical protein